MATRRLQQPSHNASRSGQIGDASRCQADGTVASRSGANTLQPLHDDLLQVPEDEEPMVPRASAIWDWEAPNLEESDSSWYYEPQGELLTANRDRNGASKEFTIPETVPGSGVTWSPHNTLQALHTGNTSQATLSSLAQASGQKRKAAFENALLGPDPKRPFKSMTEADGATESQQEDRQPTQGPHAQGGPARARSAAEPVRRPMHRPSGPQRTLTDPSMPMILPARKVFPIQIGDKLFRLSGASISSDAPSYFSQFFEEQLRQNEGADSVRTLYIDRDPSTFEDISLHLQGYHIQPRDGPHFVRLFADAQFFSLSRLTQQLFSSTIYIRIGDSEFQIPRDLFSNPGDSPNYFSLGFAVFFTTPQDAFPGLSQRTLLRPPSLLPPSVPTRSAKTFADLLHVLKGYPLEIRNEEHRAELLRDARYFHLKGLEQRLIPHQISFNLARQQAEIVMRLEDIRQSGVSFVADDADSSSGSTVPSPASSSTVSVTGPGWVHYQRPYVDAEPYALIIEITGDESMRLSVAPGSPTAQARLARATFHRQTLARMTSLFSVIASKMNLPVTQPLGLMMLEREAGATAPSVSPGNTGVSEEKVKARIGPDANVIIDGKVWPVRPEDVDSEDEDDMDVDANTTARSRRRRTADEEDGGKELVVKRSQWRLRVQPAGGGGQTARGGMEVILGAVKIEAYRNERARNAERGFLV